MADRERVIKKLAVTIQSDSEDWDTVELPIEQAKEILALLKEQEAVEARKRSSGKPKPWTSWWYICGDCGQEIEYRDRFCRWCGRPVKWDE